MNDIYLKIQKFKAWLLLGFIVLIVFIFSMNSIFDSPQKTLPKKSIYEQGLDYYIKHDYANARTILQLIKEDDPKYSDAQKIINASYQDEKIINSK